MNNTSNSNQKSRRRFLKIVGASAAFFYAPTIKGNSSIGKSLPPETAAFIKACQEGTLKKVQELLALDPTLLSAKDGLGRSAFAIALLAGHKHVGDFLKESGVQPDLHETVLDLDWDRYNDLVGEENEETVKQINADHPIGGTLMWAAAAGGAGKDIWRVYANCGDPNGNPQQKAGSTPLQKALTYPDLAIAELTAASLLSNDANPNPSLNAAPTPLHLAAERGSYELTEMLIRLGADVNIRDQHGRTAAQSAAYFGHKPVFELLTNHHLIPRTCRTSRAAYDLDGKPYQAPNMQGIPLFQQGNIVGMAHRNLNGVQQSISADPRLAHAIATTSERAVEAGAHMGRKDMVELLIKHGAPYSLPSAVLLSDFTSVKRMLDEDPNRIQERGAHDFALLWYSIFGGSNLEMLQLLLDRGAKVEEQHFLGTTALHWACLRGPIELVEMLVENGADVNRSGRKFKDAGETPLQMCQDEQIANYLKSKGAR